MALRLGARGKLFSVALLVNVASLAGADVYLARALDAEYRERIHHDALVRAELARREVAGVDADLGDLGFWDAEADALGRLARARVTIVRADGVVVGDSSVPAPQLASLANHGDRPEVREALARGAGSDVRTSDTVHARMEYVALPFAHRGATGGVVRLALSLSEADAAVARLHRAVAIATVLACAVAVLLASVSAHWMARVLGLLTSAANRMAAGDLSVRTGLRGGDEVSQLGLALDQLAGNLSRAVAELRNERDVLQGTLDAMEEGVLLVDGGGRVVRVNPALRAALLLDGDAPGRPLAEAVPVPPLLELAAEGRAAVTTREVEVRGLEPRRLMARAGPLPGAEGSVLLVCRDVTDVRKLETVRRDFVANVSHELRTPVASIRSAAETLQGAAAADPAAAPVFLDVIARNAERLQNLIDDLLDLSRIESKELRLKPEPIDVAALAEHCVSLFEHRARQGDVELTCRAEAGLDPAFADRRALEQVITNLIDNAVKYCPGARVRVGAARAGPGAVEISVEDTGPGIEPKHLPRLFERFYRVDAGRSREVGGTGLGLSIVKHLVEAMGGRIRVTSAVGQGTTFRVTLGAWRGPAA
ncbi:MAG TPA: ATP-binding protein [Polyangiaceae bacterium]|nr:ATP-binding protein [Polyangiaceae bacterium]